jgi:pimeloyl-[acyl-carrier protein] methyl ester esterase
MKYYFVFCHGFGFDKSFWKNLSDYFIVDECIFLDLGYFNSEPDFFIHNREGIFVGIGHSLGLLYLTHLKIKFDILIGLNGFINFLGNNHILHGQRKVELERLMQHFLYSPQKTLKNFYQRCGVSIDHDLLSSFHQERLLESLENLKSSIVIPKNIRILIIGARDDQVVPVELLNDNFADHPNVRMVLLDEGKHGLGFLKAADVFKNIMNFINE